MFSQIINPILNTILVGIPEEFLVVITALAFLQRFDLIDFKRIKENIILLLIPTITTSITISLCKYIFVVPKWVSLSANLLMFIITLLYICKRTDFIQETKIYKISFAVLLSLFSLAVFENLYTPLMLYILNTNIKEINNNILNNFMFSAFTRLLQIIFFNLIIARQYFKGELFKNILKDKLITFVLSGTIVMNFGLWALLIKLFGNYILSHNIILIIKIFYSMMILFIPMMFFCIILFFIIHHMKRIQNLTMNHSNQMDDIYY